MHFKERKFRLEGDLDGFTMKDAKNWKERRRNVMALICIWNKSQLQKSECGELCANSQVEATSRLAVISHSKVFFQRIQRVQKGDAMIWLEVFLQVSCYPWAKVIALRRNPLKLSRNWLRRLPNDGRQQELAGGWSLDKIPGRANDYLSRWSQPIPSF